MDQSMGKAGSAAHVDPARNRYPHCILWSPLPPITWILPFIGHTGIADAEGVIYDFAGPYTIGKVNMAFGSPTRYIQLDPQQCRELSWNQGVEEGCDVYSNRMHNICFDNCHSHVAKCLNVMAYANKRDRGMLSIGVWMFFQGRFTSLSAFVKTYVPFAVLVAIVLLANYNNY